MKNYLFIIILTIFSSCATTRSTMLKNGDKFTAYENAIIDFQKCRLCRNDSVFSVQLDNDIQVDNQIVITIIRNKNTYCLSSTDTAGRSYLPTRHVIRDGKLFYWDDPNYELTQELIDALTKYNRIHPTEETVHLGSGKAATYFFCKNDLTKYKRVISRYLVPEEKWPKLKCNK